VERDGDDIRVTNRNLLKYRDEYSKKSRHTPDDVPPRTEGEGEGEAEGEKTKDTSAEGSDKAAASAPPPSRGVFELPLANKKTFDVPEDIYNECVNAYPGVSVMAELAKMRVWLLTNPRKGKTVTGMPKFINSWLGRAQDDVSKKAGGTYVNGNGKKPGIVEAQSVELQGYLDNLRATTGPVGGGDLSPGTDDGQAITARGARRVDSKSGIVLVRAIDSGL
jgi:hypothetical protein